MFYSHEILTSREGGVATVWLVATLGSKSALKKVNRKAILDVDVPKTCSVIINPEAPMALRLQSNLLFGVSRVYLQQCGYILSDAQNVKANMKTLLRIVRTAGLDPNAGKIRPEQLILQDDPGFLPDINFPDLDIDLAALDLSTSESSRRSSLLTPPSHGSSRSTQRTGEESVLGLIIPPSDEGGAGDLGGFNVPSSDQASARRSLGFRPFDDDEEGFNLDPGFTFDDDGNMILTGEDALRAHADVAAVPRGRIRSDSATSAQVRQELEEGLRAGQLDFGEPMDIDLNQPAAGDQNLILPQAEPFPSMAPRTAAATGFFRSPEKPYEESESESVTAPLQRKRRGPKLLPRDEVQELHNADLAQWNKDYLMNMDAAKLAKAKHKSTAVAKQNAAFWVFGSGIGGVGASKINHPLAMFAGDALAKTFTGAPISGGTKKRSRSGEDEEEEESDSSEAKRARLRQGAEEEIGRGEELIIGADEPLGMPTDEPIEYGRHEVQAALDDSLQFPWNRSASARDSAAKSHGFAGSAGGFTDSAGRPSSLPPLGVTGAFERRASRMTSASPLVGRGPERYSDIDIPQFDDAELLGGPPTSIAGEDFQIYGPAAGVSTQTAAQSQWMRATLDAESNNFLSFIQAEISGKNAGEGEEDELSGEPRASDSVYFEEVLPPSQNTKIVAAQALHHVLALATKGLIMVEQREDYGPIKLSLAAGI